ncbi:MAG: acetolactate synthase small subunit [Rhodococcus sp. (in: high G+C Gram-positive bacteria)]|jgi:acetolactate synthase small subunit
MDGSSSVHQPGAKQKAGELRRMETPNSLASSLERLAKLAATADVTGEDSQEFIDARNSLIVQAAKAGASRGQIARLTGVSDGTVIDILERAKNNGRQRRG